MSHIHNFPICQYHIPSLKHVTEEKFNNGVNRNARPQSKRALRTFDKNRRRFMGTRYQEETDIL